MGVNRLRTAAAQRLRAVGDRILSGNGNEPAETLALAASAASNRGEELSRQEQQVAERRASERAVACDDAAYFEFLIERAIAEGRSSETDTP